MKTSIMSYHQLFYFIASLFFMESLLKSSIPGALFFSGLPLSFLFAVFYSSMLYIFCSFYDKEGNYICSSILLILLSLIFSSQLIYFKFFKTFYSIYSATKASQIAEFWTTILIITVKNIPLIFLLFLPGIIFIRFGKRFITFINPIKMKRLYFGTFTFFAYLACLFLIISGGKDQNSPYDLYFKTNYPLLSVKKLGLITSMRLDIKRMLIGQSPSSENVPDISAKKLDETDIIEEKTQYNILNIDFKNLIENEVDESVKNMHQYFEKAEATTKNMHTGKCKGYNLILITAEGFSPYAVHESITPTLFKMVYGGYYFTNFYNPVWAVSTSDGEYVACTGLIPKSGVWSFYKSGSISMPFVMGNQLKKLGYKTMAYHNHTYDFYKRNISHPNMGYDYKGVGNGLNVKKLWPESDLEMMEVTIPEYIDNVPFHAYYMTVSGHLRYSFPGNAMASKNREYVRNLPYSEACKAYIACQIELDRALEYLLVQLEAKGLAYKTLIALSPDHYPYGLEMKEINELAGHDLERNFELYKSNFILYVKGMTPKVIDKPCSSLDIIPTISNLMGLDYDSRLLMGTDIFSHATPLVIFGNRSFITDKGRYNSESKTFTPNEGVNIDDSYVKNMIQEVNNKFFYSAKILETDYFNKVLQSIAP